MSDKITATGLKKRQACAALQGQARTLRNTTKSEKTKSEIEDDAIYEASQIVADYWREATEAYGQRYRVRYGTQEQISEANHAFAEANQKYEKARAHFQTYHAEDSQEFFRTEADKRYGGRIRR